MSTTAHVVGPYERLMLLKAVSLSGDAPVAALGALARQAVERRVDAGAIIAAGDRPWDGVYVVVEGRVTVYEAGQRLYSVGPNEAFGRLEALARVDAGVEARADLDTLVLEICATTYLSILEDHHVMTVGTLQALARMLLAAPSWLSSSMEQRFHVSGIVPPKGFNLVDRIRLLQTSGVFAHARVHSLAEIASQYEGFHAQPGTVLWREGDPGGWFVVLLEGRIDSSSKEGLRFSWTPGMVSGLFEALAGAARWHDAIAATSVTGLRLSAERLFDALEDDFAMAADVLSAVAARVRRQRQEVGESA